MSVEVRREHEEFGALGGCFVGGDAEQRRRERRVKRRALAISIALQAMVLAAIILLPFFGKGERIALAYPVPIPPYRPYAAHQPVATVTHAMATPPPCHFCAPTKIPPTIVTRVDSTPGGIGTVPIPGELIDGGFGGDPNGIPIVDTRAVVPPPPPRERRIVHVTSLDPALLTRRIEPLYPNLAKQTHREGRVELHAIIGTDGTIQALEVVSGDVLFYSSAKDAVSQWRYKPTYLNGQAVEVDTTITVIYTFGGSR